MLNNSIAPLYCCWQIGDFSYLLLIGQKGGYVAKNGTQRLQVVLNTWLPSMEPGENEQLPRRRARATVVSIAACALASKALVERIRTDKENLIKEITETVRQGGWVFSCQ